nr:hypothetical protein [Fibrobacter sp.]
WKSNMDDERILTLDKMPGWDKYVVSSSSSDPGTTRLNKVLTSKAPEVRHLGDRTRVYNLNGRAVGNGSGLSGERRLPRGYYVTK